jgi:hypothetical protein
MKLVLSDNNKKELFIALFQTLKNCSETIFKAWIKAIFAYMMLKYFGLGLIPMKKK